MKLQGMPYITGTARGRLLEGLSDDPGRQIMVLRRNALQIPSERPAGFLIIDGAPFSHAMIPLLATGVPSVIISTEQSIQLPWDSDVSLDGRTGLVTTHPVGDEPGRIPAKTSSTKTLDGNEIHLRVSVRNLDALQKAVKAKAEAIGLVRSEFLLPADGGIPDVDYYRREFGKICEAAASMPITIRLLDVGGDKLPLWLPGIEGIGGPLGLQGVRLYGQDTIRRVVKAQLAAIDELSIGFDIRALIPFLSSRDEVLHWTTWVRRELTHAVPLGAMAETPSAALQIAEWFDLVDFVALGCNDLIQCLFGADRDRSELRDYLDPYAPSLFRFLRQVSLGATEQLSKIQLCGVLPQLPGVLPVLLGLGFQIFSVEAASLPHLRQTLADTSLEQARSLAQRVCAARDTRQVRELRFPRQA